MTVSASALRVSATGSAVLGARRGLPGPRLRRASPQLQSAARRGRSPLTLSSHEHLGLQYRPRRTAVSGRPHDSQVRCSSRSFCLARYLRRFAISVYPCRPGGMGPVSPPPDSFRPSRTATELSAFASAIRVSATGSPVSARVGDCRSPVTAGLAVPSVGGRATPPCTRVGAAVPSSRLRLRSRGRRARRRSWSCAAGPPGGFSPCAPGCA